MITATVLMLALTRAEIVQRMRAPVITQSDGLVKVFASCDEDIRREYQTPVARFAADTVQLLYRADNLEPRRFDSPGIILRVGNGRTNDTETVVGVETNAGRAVTRLYLRSPGFVDRDRLRNEIVRAYYRSVKDEEISAEEADLRLRRADPKLRVADERKKLEAWLGGEMLAREMTEDEVFAETEEMLTRMRKIFEPGYASKRDVLTFASRLRLYPRTFDEPFVGGAKELAFSEAIDLVKEDPRVRYYAFVKAQEMSVVGGGRGEFLEDAADAYAKFLFALAKDESSAEELKEMLALAEMKLNAALSQAE